MTNIPNSFEAYHRTPEVTPAAEIAFERAGEIEDAHYLIAEAAHEMAKAVCKASRAAEIDQGKLYFFKDSALRDMTCSLFESAIADFDYEGEPVDFDIQRWIERNVEAV